MGAPTPVQSADVFRDYKTFRIQGTAPGQDLLALSPNGVRLTPGRGYARHRLWFGICHFAMRTWYAEFALVGRRQGTEVFRTNWKVDGVNDGYPATAIAESREDGMPPFWVNIRTQPTTTGSDLDCIPGPEGAAPAGAKVWIGRGASNNATNFLWYTLIMPPHDISGNIEEFELRPIRWTGSNIPATAIAGLNWSFLHFSVQSEIRP